jgi:hypothetical protein
MAYIKTAHFDETEYTQDELDKIKGFAAFVKLNIKTRNFKEYNHARIE